MENLDSQEDHELVSILSGYMMLRQETQIHTGSVPEAMSRPVPTEF